MSDTFEWFLGIDWGSEAHELCLLDAAGQIRGTRTVAHTAAAVHEAVQWIREQTGTAPTTIATAIETPRGVLVDTLIEVGFPVFAINPKQLDRFRDRFTAAGATDDQRDAHVLGDGLRTDRRAFRAVRPDDPLIIQLREVTRLREDLQEDERRLANRLRDQLYRVDAAWLTFSPAADEPWLWTILADAPEPHAWAQLTRRRVAATLRTHRIRRVSADAILTALQQPRLTGAPGGPRPWPRASRPWCRSCGSITNSASRPSDVSTGCWHDSRPTTHLTASHVSIVTSKFSSPCQGSEEW